MKTDARHVLWKCLLKIYLIKSLLKIYLIKSFLKIYLIKKSECVCFLIFFCMYN